MIAVDQHQLDELRDRLLGTEFLSYCAERLGHPREELKERLVTAFGEAVVGLELLQGTELAGKRVLEVGAGLGLVSMVLRGLGAEMTAIEPGAGGFDLNARLGTCVRDWLAIEGFEVLDLAAERLQPQEHGAFDLIFSVNVLEHIPELEDAVAGMCRVLRPDGMMRHTCPNYTVPYEPHFGAPLIPFFPQLTVYLLPRARGTEVWESLNFVTLQRIKRALRANGLDCRFEPGTMYQAFQRLDGDPTFRERQGQHRAVALSQALLRRLGLLGLLARLPPALATPMTFEARRVAPVPGT